MKKYMSTRKFADLMGLSEFRVVHWIDARELPYKIGKGIPTRRVIKWLAEQDWEATSELTIAFAEKLFTPVFKAAGIPQEESHDCHPNEFVQSELVLLSLDVERRLFAKPITGEEIRAMLALNEIYVLGTQYTHWLLGEHQHLGEEPWEMYWRGADEALRVAGMEGHAESVRALQPN